MYFHSLQFRRNPKHSRSGFGLIELLVSMGIMMLVLSIILTRHSAFNGAVLLKNQAYEVALAIREIQVNAVSVSGISDNSNTIVQRIQLGALIDDGNDNVLILFRDLNGNHIYDSGEQFGQTEKIDSRFEIRDVKTSSGDCASGSSVSGGKLHVIFQRPNFDAKFYNGSGNLINNVACATVEISKRDQTGDGVEVLRKIELTSTGQIAVQ